MIGYPNKLIQKLEILFLSSVFYPDNVSVSQHLTDWALYLTEKGHEVTVYTSCYAHEQNEKSIQNLKILIKSKSLDYIKQALENQMPFTGL